MVELGRRGLLIGASALAATPVIGSLDASVFERGIASVDWPGRLQRLPRGRLSALAPEGADLWLDGGHNPDGGRVLAAAMADLSERSDAPLVLVAGMLSTKDSEGFFRNFAGLAREVVAVSIPAQVAALPFVPHRYAR